MPDQSPDPDAPESSNDHPPTAPASASTTAPAAAAATAPATASTPGARPDALPLHCAEVLDLLTEHLEEALAEADRLLMDGHLEGCEDCRIRLAQLRLTIELIGKAGRRVR